jgi:asparagine synthase (glutamine-hydrolysing)
VCGICGILYLDKKRKPEVSVLKKMCDCIYHRGPDDEGQIVKGYVGLGMRRLSIIDLSTGNQPLSNEDSSVSVVFNGEIYNYRELRSYLEKKGHRFKTTSDTESIVHGYETYEEDICKKLNGMFGFAIWDNRQNKLLLARDRLGIKPFYYYVDEEKLVFASEIKAILQCPGIKKNIDLAALNNFLTFEYIPAPRSIFREIRKLEPGHWLSWQNGRIRIQKYWDLVPTQELQTESEVKEQLKVLVNDSVKLRLISDVPLGVFLSGGVDSSIIVSQMAKLMNKPVKTFSIGFKESSYNELKYARAVAQKYNTDHHEFTVEAKALELTETLIKHLDEPFGDFSIFPTYLVSKMARDYVKVTLSGDGGDELFAGYDTYRAHRFERQFYNRLPQVVKTHIFNNLEKSLSPTEKKKGIINIYKRFIQGTYLPETLYHARWMTFLHESERRKLFTMDVLDNITQNDPYDFIHKYSKAVESQDDITKTGYIDVKTYLVDNILVKVDRMSMATSLEVRVPYLDHRIVEFAFTIPPKLKMSRYNTKYIFKNTFWEDLPLEIRRRDKQGFSIPIKNWIRNELKPMMFDLLNENLIKQQGLFNHKTVSNLLLEHINGTENHSHKLWALMVFQKWYEMYGKN